MTKPLTKPRFTHDCDDCVFLGNYMGRDLYYCPYGGPTVIARHGDAGDRYASGMAFALMPLHERIANGRALSESVCALRVARLIAIDIGLVEEDNTDG